MVAEVGGICYNEKEIRSHALTWLPNRAVTNGDIVQYIKRNDLTRQKLEVISFCRFAGR